MSAVSMQNKSKTHALLYKILSTSQSQASQEDLPSSSDDTATSSSVPLLGPGSCNSSSSQSDDRHLAALASTPSILEEMCSNMDSLLNKLQLLMDVPTVLDDLRDDFTSLHESSVDQLKNGISDLRRTIESDASNHATILSHEINKVAEQQGEFASIIKQTLENLSPKKDLNALISRCDCLERQNTVVQQQIQSVLDNLLVLNRDITLCISRQNQTPEEQRTNQVSQPSLVTNSRCNCLKQRNGVARNLYMIRNAKKRRRLKKHVALRESKKDEVHISAQWAATEALLDGDKDQVYDTKENIVVTDDHLFNTKMGKRRLLD